MGEWFLFIHENIIHSNISFLFRSLFISKFIDGKVNPSWQSSTPRHVYGLPDNVILEIATNCISSDIHKLGLAMGLPFVAVQKYQIENNRDLVASFGTRAMLLDWRRKVPASEQISKFAVILQGANQIELADDLLAGKKFT